MGRWGEGGMGRWGDGGMERDFIMENYSVV